MPKLPYHGLLDSFHEVFSDEVTEWDVGLSQDKAAFTSQNPRARGAQLVWFGRHQQGALSFLKVVAPNGGGVTRITQKKSIDAVGTLLKASIADHWHQEFGVTVNVYGAPGGGGKKSIKRRTIEELVAFIEATDFAAGLRYAPKGTNAGCFYMCDPLTCVWGSLHDVLVEKGIVDALKTCKELTEEDQRHVQNRRGRADLHHVLASKVIDASLESRLDANLDVFALDNGVFDMAASPPAFRPTRPDDWVRTTAGWASDEAAGHAGRAELDLFLSHVMPVVEERHVLLCYFAGLMSGRRTVKKFVLLTDRRSGANGKSTLARLFKKFFGA